ncbi:MAG: hypothetical protein HQL38_19420, partial [Alphaproteobacteria bacterium]|nr:hypothetical protein [Alphaproteobacteria bacterium]
MNIGTAFLALALVLAAPFVRAEEAAPPVSTYPGGKASSPPPVAEPVTVAPPIAPAPVV